MPAFAVPCPPALVTAGFLLGMAERRWLLSVIPIAWCAIGAVAALELGILADLALLPAGLALAARHALGRR